MEFGRGSKIAYRRRSPHRAEGVDVGVESGAGDDRGRLDFDEVQSVEELARFSESDVPRPKSVSLLLQEEAGNLPIAPGFGHRLVEREPLRPVAESQPLDEVSGRKWVVRAEIQPLSASR